jgi:hypothetical protein
VEVTFFKNFCGLDDINTPFCAKDEFYFIYFLPRIGYYRIVMGLMVNILSSLRSIPQ